MQNVGLGGVSKRADRGKPAPPPSIVRHNRGGPGLLEHDFRDQDGVRVARAAPGEIAFVVQKPPV